MAPDTQSHELSRREIIRLTGGAGAVALAGCVGGDGDGDGDSGTDDGTSSGSGTVEGTVRTWSTGPGEEHESTRIDMAAEWASEQLDGKTLELEHDPVQYEGYNDKLKVEIGSGESPDIVQLQTMWFDSYYNEDQLLDISPYIDDGFLDEFRDVWIDAWRRDGGLYGLPKDVQVYVLHYNTGFLDEAGIDEMPETWEEFRGALETIDAETDVPYPLVEWSQELLSFFSMKFQLDGRVMNEDNTECVIANDGNVQVLEYIRGLREDDLLGFVDEVEGSATTECLAYEECAATIGGAWLLPFPQENEPDVYEKLDTTHVPHPADADRATGVFTLPWGVSANTDNPEAIATGLQGMNRNEPLWEWIKRGVALSPRIDHGERDFFQDDRRLKGHVDAMEYAEGPVWMYGENSEEILNAINQTLETVVRGNMTAREGLETVQDQVNNDILD